MILGLSSITIFQWVFEKNTFQFFHDSIDRREWLFFVNKLREEPVSVDSW